MAIKLEPKTSKLPQLEREFHVYKALAGGSMSMNYHVVILLNQVEYRKYTTTQTRKPITM
jgi:hypothetical protein